ncbi:hypothetical protein HK100_012561 [Physocladia obscura]|uniref:Uncharacterized protein n=1 Tax=Physocladia obscura TaxID=109957 RepID=A0AAD5SZP1_9FUNG|nr:hypothetical protein HK100_012561 [Physocladia obscura]
MKKKQTNLTNYFAPVPAASPTIAMFPSLSSSQTPSSSSSLSSSSLPVPAKRWKGKERADGLVSIEEDNDKDLMIAIAASRQSLRAYELGGGNILTFDSKAPRRLLLFLF